VWGGVKMATQAFPPPKEADSPPKQADLVKAAISPRGGWSQKSPGDQMWKSRDKCGFGVKVANSSMSGFSKKPF
jgi:hypothetical protein